MEESDRYIPLLRYGWLTPLYDPLLRRLMPELALKRRLIDQAQIASGHRVLDLGSGTGTLAILIKQTNPGSEVVGLDADPKALALSHTKAPAAGVEVRFDHGLAFRLPYGDNSFDRVLSSLVFHHLSPENKRRALREVFRVLRPGGELHILDFGKPHHALARLVSLVMRRFEETADNIKGVLPEMLRQAGLTEVEVTAQQMTVFGTLSFYKGRKPALPVEGPRELSR